MSRQFRVTTHHAQKCDGCDVPGATRSLDIRVPARRTKTGVLPPGWCPLVQLCTDCWMKIAEEIVPQ